VIDSHPGHSAGPDELEQKFVRSVEDLGQFHPDRGEIVDVKEAAVIDFLRRHAPEGEAIGLVVEQMIERIKASGLARLAVDLRDGLPHRGLDLGRFLATPLQPALDDFLFPRPLRDPLRIGFGAPRQIFERRDDALKFGVKILVLERRQLLERDLENVAVGARGNGEFVIVIAKKKCAGLEMNLQLRAFQDASVLIPEDRKQDLVLQIGLERFPIDIEIGGVGGARPVFEYVHPPLVERLADAHVVRHEIDDLSHAMRMEIGDPRVVVGP
jgi:hypothetical protein